MDTFIVPGTDGRENVIIAGITVSPVGEHAPGYWHYRVRVGGADLIEDDDVATTPGVTPRQAAGAVAGFLSHDGEAGAQMWAPEVREFLAREWRALAAFEESRCPYGAADCPHADVSYDVTPVLHYMCRPCSRGCGRRVQAAGAVRCSPCLMAGVRS